MIGNITIFDCTFREAGYQTGWFFDKDFCIDYYKFAQAAGIDYLELGFFHNKEADPNRGYFDIAVYAMTRLKIYFYLQRIRLNYRLCEIYKDHYPICFQKKKPL